jgi:hypothetical protein
MRCRKLLPRLTPKGLAAATLITAMVMSSAEGAFLRNTEGAVSANYGRGFVSVSEGAVVNAGDRVRVGAGATEIFYENGCSQRLGPNQTVVVLSAPPPCGGDAAYTGATVAQDAVTAGALLAAGAGIAIGISNGNSNGVSP